MTHQLSDGIGNWNTFYQKCSFHPQIDHLFKKIKYDKQRRRVFICRITDAFIGSLILLFTYMADGKTKSKDLFGSLPDYSLSHINDCHALSLSKLCKKMILMPIIEMRLNSDLESCTQSIQVLGMPLLSTTRKNENYLPSCKSFQISAKSCKF